MEKDTTLLVIHSLAGLAAQDECEALKEWFSVKEFPITDGIAARLARRGILPAAMHRLAAHKLSTRIEGDFDAVLCYSDKQVAGSLAALHGVACIERKKTGVAPFTDAVSPASRHSVSDHALTFISPHGDENTLALMKAMAVARPASRILWRPAGAMIATESSLPNLSISPVALLKEALSAGEVDWLVTLDSTIENENVSLVLESLAAGIPVAAVDGTETSRLLTDDCAVIFGPNPTNEEFVRGMLPFIDSDLRSQGMSRAARELWSENYSTAVNAPLLAAKISQLIKSKSL